MSEEEQLRYVLQMSSMEMGVTSPKPDSSVKKSEHNRNNYAAAASTISKTNVCKSNPPQNTQIEGNAR